MRIVCISDTHNLHDRLTLPDGDVLVHAGDFTRMGSAAEVERFDAWLGTLPHRHKIVVAGNHDFLFEQEPAAARARLTHATYLQDEETSVDGLQIWGAPWQPEFFQWAFNLPRGQALADKWALAPAGVDILVTHGPPHGIGDRVFDGERVGCADLRAALQRIRPRLHVFGHIHESYGRWVEDGTTFVNASSCNLRYVPVHAPIVVDL